MAALLKPRSIAIVHSNDIMPTSADGTRPFIQQSDFYYLTGIAQEESVLVLFPDSPENHLREILFLRETNETIAIWEGHKFTQEEATQLSGIPTALWNEAMPATLTQLIFEAEHIYLNTNEHLRSTSEVTTRDDRFRQWCMEKYPLHRYERLAPLMHALRAIKHPLEIAAIQQACHITEMAFRRILEFVKPGVWEFEIEAEIVHEFLRNRSHRPAYESIIASGANACVLHYILNNAQCKDGDLLLMDFGAEYANYNADLTRTIPVNGRFTPRQRAVYDAVLRVQKAAIEMLVPGNRIPEYHKEVGKIMESELIGLGLLNKHEVARQDPSFPLYRKYFMHGTSHHLGIDVHDYGNKYRTFEPGMVFTCEPGIYIREEGIGIRIENNLVVTEKEPLDLMASIPREAEEIETLMQAGRLT